MVWFGNFFGNTQVSKHATYYSQDALTYEAQWEEFDHAALGSRMRISRSLAIASLRIAYKHDKYHTENCWSLQVRPFDFQAVGFLL